MSFVSIAKQFLTAVAKELDPYTTEKSKIKVDDFKEVTLLTPEHIQFAKYGRGPGKQPPLNKILEFVKDKGIIFKGTDQRGTAFAIAKSIGEKGTLNWKPGAPNAIEEAINNNILDYYKKLNNFVIETYDPEIQEIYEKIFPTKVTLKL